jgi:NADH-quinone oxidoreductase subunit H
MVSSSQLLLAADSMLSPTLVQALVKIVILIGGLMTAAAYFVLLERRMAAWIQDRRGPNRVGIPLTGIRLFGLGQPLADGVKFIFKEAYTPSHVDRWMYLLAPISILVAALVVFAVIPIGGMLPAVAGLSDGGEPISLVVIPGFDSGLLLVFALSEIAVYGVLLGGWASNNKYSFLGGLRSSAQLIAYELPLGLAILGVVLATGSMNLERVISRQAESGLWFALAQPLGFVVFVIAAFAESARVPFDLPECEQELVGGYHTEYSGIKLLLFLVAEFLHMITASFLIVILFLGGWHFWGLTGGAGAEVGWLQSLLRVAVLLGKVVLVILFFMLTRWSWPRFRFDQLMALAWKIMLPLGIANFVVVAALGEIRAWYDPEFVDRYWEWGLALPNWLSLVLGWLAVAYSGTLVTDNRPQPGPQVAATRGEVF